MVAKMQSMSVGEQIRKYRRERNFTQAELASMLGIDKQNISRYESGKAEPRKSTLQKLSEALEVSVEQLLGLRAEQSNELPKDPRLLNLLCAVDRLPEKDKEALIRLLNIVVRENRIQSAIAS